MILSPSDHRVHHARNPEYIDKNFCNTLTLWDKLFGTYKEENDGTPIEYGTSPKVNQTSFFDMYMGEFFRLFKDIKNTDSLKNKILYCIMPPSWSPNLTKP